MGLRISGVAGEQPRSVLGLLGYFLGVLIVRPLNRLTSGAAAFAAGHLDVDLPVVGGGEVGYLTSRNSSRATRWSRSAS